MNIYEKMSAATAEIARVPKSMTVGTGKNQYKAVAEADILKAVKDAEAKYKIFSFPFLHEVQESRTIVRKTEYGEKEDQFIRIKAVYRFIDMESTADFVEVIAFGDGVDSLDKAPGKAVTYAGKYALMKAYKVETGDDSDRTPSDDLAGHDIWKIKSRIERHMTQCIQSGMTQGEILAAIGASEKQLKICMDAFQSINALEIRLRKL